MKIDLGVWGRRLPLVAAAVLFAGANLAFFLAYRSSTQTRRAALEARRDELQGRGREPGGRGRARRGPARAPGRRLRGDGDLLRQAHRLRARDPRAGRRGGARDPEGSRRRGAPDFLPDRAGPQAAARADARSASRVHCDYARFKRLLRAFETSKAWLVVRDISISRDSDQPGPVQVQLELVTYFAERDERRRPRSRRPARRPRTPAKAPLRRGGPADGGRTEARLAPPGDPLRGALAVVLLLAVVRWRPGRGRRRAPESRPPPRVPRRAAIRSGDEAPAFAGRARRPAAAKEVNPDDVPALDPKDFEAGKPEGRRHGLEPRPLRRSADPTKRPVPTPTPAPPAAGRRALRRAPAAAAAHADAAAARHRLQVPRHVRAQGSPDRRRAAGRPGHERAGRRHAVRQVHSQEGRLRVDRRRLRGIPGDRDPQRWGSRHERQHSEGDVFEAISEAGGSRSRSSAAVGCARDDLVPEGQGRREPRPLRPGGDELRQGPRARTGQRRLQGDARARAAEGLPVPLREGKDVRAPRAGRTWPSSSSSRPTCSTRPTTTPRPSCARPGRPRPGRTPRRTPRPTWRRSRRRPGARGPSA